MTESNDVLNLIREHEAINAQIKLLISSLTDPSSGLQLPSVGNQTPLKNQLKGYGWALQNLRDAAKQHIEIDDRIVSKLTSSIIIENNAQQHREILTKINEAILFVNDAAENDLDQTKISKYKSDLIEAVNTISKLVESHTAEENVMFRRFEKHI
jgi:hypothetical protein